MRKPRLFVEMDLFPGQCIDLPDSAFRHCVHSLRLNVDSPVILFNGDGFDYFAALTQVNRRSAQVTIHRREENRTESTLGLCLVQGLSKADHMDFTIQKAVELGVHRISPIICQRSQRVPSERLARRQSHWKSIAESACEQCGRSEIPLIDDPINFHHWIANPSKHTLRLMFLPDSETSLYQVARDDAQSVEVLIGPEGGFTDEETSAAINVGITCLSLGPRVLRTETAAIAALTLAQAQWGDLS